MDGGKVIPTQPRVGETKKWMKGKSRRHHNNKGSHQTKGGKTYGQVKRMSRRLGIPFKG